MSPPLSATPRNIKLLYLHNLLNDCRFQAAFVVIYFNQITGSYAASMSILALETMTSALLDIPTGIFSDRMGRKYTLALGSLCSTLAVTCYAFSSTLSGLTMGAILAGSATCLFSGNNTALIYESLKTEGLESAFHHYQGRAGSMFQLALGLSALLGGFFSSFGLRFVFLLGILPQFLSIFVCFFIKEPSVHTAHKSFSIEHLKELTKLAWGNKRLRLLILGQAISYGAGESSFNFKSTLVNVLWPSWAVGVYRAVNHGFGVLSFWFAGKVIDRVKAPQSLIWAEIYWFVTQGIAVLLSNVFSPVLMMVEAIAFGPYIVAKDQLLQNEFTDAQRATLGSVAGFMSSAFYAALAICIGAISDHFGLAAGIGFGTCVCALSIPIYVALFRKHF